MEKDKWIEIERKGNIKTEVYIPSNYPRPIAIDCKPSQPERLSEKTLYNLEEEMRLEEIHFPCE